MLHIGVDSIFSANAKEKLKILVRYLFIYFFFVNEKYMGYHFIPTVNSRITEDFFLLHFATHDMTLVYLINASPDSAKSSVVQARWSLVHCIY